MKQECGKLQWHPAFDAVLRIEFEGELDKLQIIDEYQLTRKPLQMDNLIIKKKKGVQIKKILAGYSESTILSNINLRKIILA